MSGPADAALRQAADLSRQILALADSGDVDAVRRLDAERRQLLHAARRAPQGFGDEARRLWREIAELNDRAIGFVEHRQRCKARDMDMLAVGKRAVRAYASNGRFR